MICVDVLTHEKKWSSFRGDKRIEEDIYDVLLGDHLFFHGQQEKESRE